MPVAVVKRGKLTLVLACLTDRAFIELHCIDHDMSAERSMGRVTVTKNVANTAFVRVGAIGARKDNTVVIVTVGGAGAHH